MVLITNRGGIAVSRLDYIKDLKESKNKAITITIEENIINQVEDAAQNIGVSRNQIITESLKRFIKDYNKVQNPNYFILKSTHKDIEHPSIFMLDGNKACAWDLEQYMIRNLEIGDYVFILDIELGIVGSGTVTSEQNFSTLGTIISGTEDIDDYEEIYVNIDYDVKAKDHYDELEEESSISIMVLKEFLDELTKLPSNDEVNDMTVREFNLHRRKAKELVDLISSPDGFILNIGKYLGESLKNKYKSTIECID